MLKFLNTKILSLHWILNTTIEWQHVYQSISTNNQSSIEISHCYISSGSFLNFVFHTIILWFNYLTTFLIFTAIIILVLYNLNSLGWSLNYEDEIKSFHVRFKIQKIRRIIYTTHFSQIYIPILKRLNLKTIQTVTQFRKFWTVESVFFDTNH